MVILSPLRRKVLRDVRRLWAQVLAVALVLAAGVSTLILGTGAYSALYQTRAAYYEANRFADVFAGLTRAPRALVGDIAEIDGVLAVEGRIWKIGLLDIAGMPEPGSVALVSLPGSGRGGLNQLSLRSGRLPDPQVTDEAVISEGFAKAHRLRPGSSFGVLMNGQQRQIRVAGIALSPEFIYALGPGEAMPDPRRFGIVWMPAAALEAAFDLEGAFSDVVLKLAPGASAERVIGKLDELLAPYGGIGATGRNDQISHAFLDAELKQLSAMVKVLPPIFLVVAAMLVNMTLSRMIALEREQIGLLKAIGYSPQAIAAHYLEFVALIAVIGIAIGFAAGSWLGAGLAQMYARFFSFPFLIFSRSPDIYALAAIVTLGAAIGGALNAVRAVLRLPPAVAMAPPAPAQYRQSFLSRIGLVMAVRQTTVMTARHLLRWPVRSGSSILGIAMAVAVLVASQWPDGSLAYMIDLTFFRTERQDAMIAFADRTPYRAVYEAERLPGVLVAEPFRAVAVEIRHRNLSRRLSIMGLPADAAITRVLSPELKPMSMPEDGLILSEALAAVLDVRPGELVTVALRDGERRSVAVPVAGVSLGYIGLSAHMRIDALNRLLREGAVISGVKLLTDPAEVGRFYAAAKTMPKTGFVAVTALTLGKFRDTIAENINIMITVYVGLAMVIAVGVVYNFARISLSEQGRELASLRVLGFTRAEVAAVLLAELAVVVALAQPLGWIIGYGIAAGMVEAFSSDLYRVPLIVGRVVFAKSSLIVLAAALVSAWLIRGRIDSLDMIEVLKTRE